MKERVNFARQHGDQNVRPSIVIVVLKDGSHSRERLAVSGESCACFESTFGECSVAVVVEKKLAHAVVRYEDVGESIVIVVREADAERAPLERSDTGSLADVFKSAIAAIAVEEVRGRREFGGRAVCLPLVAANFAVLGVPYHVASDKQVEVTVVIVIEKSCRTAPATSFDARFSGHVCKGAVAIIVIQSVFSVVRYVEVGEAVVVVIADCYAHAVVAVARVR